MFHSFPFLSYQYSEHRSYSVSVAHAWPHQGEFQLEDLLFLPTLGSKQVGGCLAERTTEANRLRRSMSSTTNLMDRLIIINLRQ